MEALLIALEDPHPFIRAASAEGLGRAQARKSLSALCRLRRDEDSLVRRTAKRAIKRLGGGCQRAPVPVFLEISSRSPERSAKIEHDLRARLAERAELKLLRRRKKQRGLRFKIRATWSQSAQPVTVRCALALSFIDLKKNTILGRGGQKGEVEVESPAKPATVKAYIGACLDALIPAAEESLSTYLSRRK